MFFIESGEVMVVVEHDDGRSAAVRKVRPGTVVGEMSAYLGGRRSASVVATEDTVVFRLSGEAFERLRADAPSRRPTSSAS